MEDESDETEYPEIESEAENEDCFDYVIDAEDSVAFFRHLA